MVSVTLCIDRLCSDAIVLRMHNGRETTTSSSVYQRVGAHLMDLAALVFGS